MNRRVSAITPSLTLAITSKAKAMKAAGEEVWNFGAGEPDFDTPAHIKAAAERAMGEGKTKYAPAAGLPELREAIAAKLNAENGLPYAMENIVVSNGAKHSLFNVIFALCSPGDEVLIPAPYWVSYPEMVRVAGASPVFVTASEIDGFKISPSDLEGAVTPRTRLLILNSPSNPAGIAYTREEIAAIGEVVVRHDLRVIADEIYEKIIYDGLEHASIGGLSDKLFSRTITINGFSKGYSMTGWRLGYCAAAVDIAAAVTGLQSHSTSGANTFAQYGAVEALRGSQDCVSEMREAFTKRRDYMYQRLTSIDGVSCVMPSGAFYMLPNILSFGLDSSAFAQRLLDQKKVAVIPGAAFGADTNVRLSYACSTESIEKGLAALEEFVRSL